MNQYSICVSENAALNEPVLYRGSLESAFEYASQIGVQGIEIHVRDAKSINPEKLLKASIRSNIKVSAIATGLAKRIDGLSLIDDDLSMRKAAIQRVREHLDLAQILSCPVIIGSLRSNIPSQEKAEEYRKRLRDALCALDDYITDKNTFVVLEAINRYENNYLNTAEETVSFINSCNAKHIKLLLDTFHMNIEESDFEKPIEQYKDYIGYIHLSDNTRHYPGSGMINFQKILSTLRSINYSGWLGLEYLPIPNERDAAIYGYTYLCRNAKKAKAYATDM